MKLPTNSPAFLCADQADNRIRLSNPFAAGDRKPTLWSYPPEDSAALKWKPTDAKRVEIGGVAHLLAAYHGRVQLVKFEDGKLVRDLSSHSSCHSAELLPDGSIVSANSNHGKLRHHRTEQKFSDLKLPYAHGVTWDQSRKCLWALGDEIYRLGYSEGELKIEKKFELPISPTGHDLFPLRNEAKLLVSNNEGLFLFDIASSKFEQVSDLHSIKSASQHQDGTIWVSDPKDVKGAPSYQSDSVLRVRPAEPKLGYRNLGTRFYKARWWQKVSFSY